MRTEGGHGRDGHGRDGHAPAWSFLALCRVLEAIGQTRSVKAKSQLFGAYLGGLRSLPGVGSGVNPGLESAVNSAVETAVETAALACRFTGEGALERIGAGRGSGAGGGKSAGAGSRTIALAACEFCGIDHEAVFRPCRTATGSGSEAIGLLMENLPWVRERQRPRVWSLQEMDELFRAVAAERGREGKQRLLMRAWEEMTPLEARTMIRMLGQGSLRIGFEIRSLLHAVADAFDAPRERVRYAHMVSGSVSETLRLAWEGRLEDARFTMFRPLSFMLASPLEPGEADGLELEAYWAEEKFDGIRCQIHAEGGRVAFYSRDLNEITGSFPDVAEDLGTRGLAGCVIDGELVAFREGRILPFQKLQRRLGVKKPARKLLAEIPAVLIAYDLLYVDGEDLLGRPLGERREKLERLCGAHGIAHSRLMRVETPRELEERFDRALENGNEGLMLKRRDSLYEFGQRGRAWRKVKQPAGSIDTVMLYAHAGSGRRGGSYSDFTLGVSVQDDPRFEEAYVPIGKAYGGYTDRELRELNRRIRSLITARYGPTVALEPGIVVELEFDQIMVNRRTKAGLSLRFPRFRAIRWDLAPEDADTLEHVERMVREAGGRRNRRQTEEAAFIVPDTPFSIDPISTEPNQPDGDPHE